MSERANTASCTGGSNNSNDCNALEQALEAWTDLGALSLKIGKEIVKSRIQECNKRRRQHQPNSPLRKVPDVDEDDAKRQRRTEPLTGGFDVCRDNNVFGNLPLETDREAEARERKKIRRLVMVLAQLQQAHSRFQRDIEAIQDEVDVDQTVKSQSE